MAETDTIVAVSTPPGRGGLGVVRLSGPSARAIASALFANITLQPRHATLAQYRDSSGALLDEAILTWFQAPHSATAEDVVEISAHGAPVLLDALLRDACAHGARLAEPGEFTRRAFFHGRLDLAQAEAVGDLIAAHTLFQARTAARQLQGSVAQLLRPAHQQLLELIARLEAGIDFADNDVTVLADDALRSALTAVQSALAALAAGFQHGRFVREGIRLALLGRPNVGKSSLFNRLLCRERAIVTAEAGTTRDLVEDSLDWDGIPVQLVDTAGIRDPQGQAEHLGIQKSWQAAADADLVLAVFDTSSPPTPEDVSLDARLATLPQALRVGNKFDLPQAPGWPLAGPGRVGDPGAPSPAEGQAGGVAEPHQAPRPSMETLLVSALTGQGLDALRAAVRQRLLPAAGSEAAYITNARHAQQIQLAIGFLGKCLAAVGAVPHEVLLVDLYEALHALDAITGQTTVEDILGVIFSRFCIGK